MKRNGECGFTLIELVIVMVVLGILVALVRPNLHFLTARDTLRASTTSVTSSLYLARTKAVSAGDHYGVQFSSTGEFHLVSDPKGTPAQFGVSYRLDEGITVVENTFVNGLAIFNEYGQLDRSCLPMGEMTGVVTLTGGTVDTTRVEVTFISGRIRETNL